MWPAISSFKSLGKTAQKVMGGLIRVGVREAIQAVPGVGSVARLVEELADYGVDRLADSAGALPDLKEEGEAYSADQLQAIEDWMRTVQDSLGQLTEKVARATHAQEAMSWDHVFQSVQEALEKNAELAEDFSRVEKKLEEQTLSLHRIERILSRVLQVEFGNRKSLREIKQILIDHPSMAEWARFRKSDPEMLDLMSRADALILAGKREEGDALYEQMLRKRGWDTEIVARHFGFKGKLRGEGDKVAAVLEKAEVEPSIRAKATQVGGSLSTHRSQPGGPTWEALPRGLVIGHKYRIMEEIGRGGMASVYRVVGVGRRNAGQIYALKIPAPSFFSDPGFAERFTNEIDLSLKLAEAGRTEVLLGRPRPPIVPAHEEAIFIDPQTGKELYGLVMDYIEGWTLAHEIEMRAALGQRFTEEEILAFLSPICAALDFAHQQKDPVIHRDVTPRNILIDKSRQVWLTDFGIGRVLTEAKGRHVTQEGVVVGTWAYLPDELREARNKDRVGPYTDVYILGKVLTELMTFSVDGYIDETLGYPVGWDEVVTKATSKVPRLRYESAGALCIALKGELPPTPEELRRQKAETLSKLLARSDVKAWVEKRLNGWDDPQWRRLLAGVKKLNLGPVDQAELGCALQGMREKLLADKKAAEAEAARVAAKKAAEAAAVKPKDPPPHLVAPFNGAKAKETQAAWAAFLGRKAVEEFDLGKGVKLSMALIPPGTFMMGSPEGEEYHQADEKLHRVKLTKPFYMGVHPVTVGQFKAFATAKGYKTEAEQSGGAHVWTGSEWKQDPKANWRNPGFAQDDKHPVTCVSWNDAKNFWEWLSVLLKQPFTLPTEAQWEYACRCGTTTPFFFGETISTDVANYDGNYTYGSGKKGEYREQTTPAGKLGGNHWGLQDMHGNVWEWCLDWFGVYKGDADDDTGPEEGSFRVIRGGSWSGGPGGCRSAVRGRGAPGSRDDCLGFRVLSSPSGF